ncbi:MAG: SPOR domain-containing protein [Deltaproteobacteria bacterium]|nr:SPOR domain-containing protein [Deltaproteobacteria bacterium]
MKSNLKRQFDFESIDNIQFDTRLPPLVEEKSSASLNLKQLAFLWSVICAMIFSVFVLGLFIGREQGIKAALNEQGREAIRLPISRAIMPVDNALGYDNVKAVKSLETAGNLPLAPANSAQPSSPYDFSAAAVTQPSVSVVSPLKANPTASPSVSTFPSGKVFIQVATADNMEAATKIVEKAKSAGYPTKVQETEIGNKSYFRVLRGPFENRTLADAEVGKIEALGLSSAKPFIRTID